jgi:hypothetical protein
MTDINDLRRKAQAAREFSLVVGERSFTLRLPTAHELRVEALLISAATAPARSTVMVRSLLEKAVVSWSGVTCEDLAPHGGPEPAELVDGAVELLLDHQTEVAAALMDAFVDRMNERATRKDEAAKN